MGEKRHYVACIDLEGRSVLVVGAGRVAHEKAAGLLECGAAVTVVAPDATVGLREMAAAGAVDWAQKTYDTGDLHGAFLVIAAANATDVNAAVSKDALARGILVCNTDEPDAGNFASPSVMTRGDLTLTVSTGGKSPTLAAVLRERLSDEFGDEWAALTEILGRLRGDIQAIGDEAARKNAVRRVLADDAVWECLRAGDMAEAEGKVRRCLLSSSE